MQAIKQQVKVGAGRQIFIERPELRAGTEAKVIIMVEERPEPRQAEDPPPLASFLGSGKGCFSSAEESDAFLRAERDAWDS
jgi:hypothetical protein